mgnify:CR=1 FL=1
MTVNRRDFLRGLFASAALYNVADIIPLPPEEFLLGRSIHRELIGKLDPIFFDVLHEDAKKILKPGTLYEVRRTIPYDFGRSHGIGWLAESGDMQRMTTDPIRSEEHTSELQSPI